ncbi:MAG: ABC transporter transmembrane domain-containing protein, partial [Actinomyces sp.]|nr:ABC transporter transmembrane domain-containing protein [Actinomyces sp.]
MNESRWKTSARLINVARPVMAPLGISITARVIGMVLHVAQYATAGWVIGKIASDISTMPLLTVAVVLVVLSLIKALMRYLEQFSGHWVAFRSLALLRGYFYDRLEPQAPARTESEDSGDLLSRVTKDIDRIEVFFAHTLAPGLSAIICPVIVLAYLGCAVSWWAVLALAPFLVAVSIVVPQLGVRTTSDAARTIRATRGDLSQHVTDTVQGVRE